MKYPRLVAAALCAALLAFALPAGSRADEFSKAQRSAIEKIVHDYLLSHPEILPQAMQELEKRQNAAVAVKQKAAVQKYSDVLFNSPDQVTLGNPKGNVTLVEFFDYNCPYCKHAMGDMLTLLRTDSNLKVVLKEFPVLGQGSEDAARVAVAVRMQDKSGKKYLEFHKKLLGGRGRADGARALAVAKEVGVDMTRLQKDLKSPEIEKTIDQDKALADALGMNGTPSYVVGKEVVVGAIGLDGLKTKINEARCGKASC
jgi:protein-disulfide isomerase